jgi:pimeloyl-ACP methyl ester carboxylesterase
MNEQLYSVLLPGVALLAALLVPALLLHNGSASKEQGAAVSARYLGPAPGKYIRTSLGRTHYMDEGRGPLIVMQHGLGQHVKALEALAVGAIKAGFRVVRYDLYDRGWSETDPVKYPIRRIGEHPLAFTTDMHVEQMREVLTALKLEHTPFVHVGHSTGGGVGLAYAVAHPEYVRGLVLAAAVVLPVAKPLAARLANMPILGPLVVRALGLAAYKKLARTMYRDPDSPAVVAILEPVFAATEHNPRLFAAIRSTNASFTGFVGSAEATFTQLCRDGKVPLHLVWGHLDKSVPYPHCQRLRAIAEAHGATVSELSFADVPHNIWSLDAKPAECVDSIVAFAGRHLANKRS